MAEVRAERDFRVRSRTAAWALERAYVAAPLVLRLTVGPMLLAHGIQKLLGLGAAAAGFEQMGVAPGMLWATVVMLIELLGGAGLILGLFTRFWAFANLVVQVVALLFVHLPQGFFIGPERTGIEFTLVNSGVLAALVILGAGAISIDHIIHRRTGRLETRRTAEIPSATTTTTSSTPPASTPPGTRV
jgi:putative oxidoreductase